MIHTLSCSSAEAADTLPSLHFAGTFGHEASNWNVGNPPSPLWGACTAAVWPKTGQPIAETITTNATRTIPATIFPFMGFLLRKTSSVTFRPAHYHTYKSGRPLSPDAP